MWELRDKSSLEESRNDLITEGGYVEGMSGMTCVVPAWQLLEVLDMPELKKLRQPEIDRVEEEREKLMAKYRPTQPKPESAPPPAPQFNVGEAPRNPKREEWWPLLRPGPVAGSYSQAGDCVRLRIEISLNYSDVIDWLTGRSAAHLYHDLTQILSAGCFAISSKAENQSAMASIFRAIDKGHHTPRKRGIQ
jgi:hypothetical protein